MPRRKSTNSTKTATRYDVIVNMSAAAADEGWIADRSAILGGLTVTGKPAALPPLEGAGARTL